MSPRFSLSNQRVALTNNFQSGWLAVRVTRRRFHFCVIGVMSRGFRKATVAGVYAAQPARTREPIRPVMHGLSISGGVRKRTLACVRGCAIGRCGARRTEKREQGRRRRRRRWRRKRWRKRRDSKGYKVREERLKISTIELVDPLVKLQRARKDGKRKKKRRKRKKEGNTVSMK